MSFPAVVRPLLDLSTPSTHYFGDGLVVTVPLTVPARNHRERTVVYDAVVLDAHSTRFGRSNMGYRLIRDTLNSDATLLTVATHSRKALELDDVVDNCGYGIVAMVVVNKHATFNYHVLSRGRLRRDPVRIDTRRRVLSASEYGRLYPAA